MIQVALEVAAVQANLAYSRFRRWVEREDVLQELVLWCVLHEAKVCDWVEEAEGKSEDDLRAGERALAVTLRREAEKYCRWERAQKCRYDTVDEAFYTKGAIEEMLGYVYNGWTPFDNSGDGGKRTGPANEGGNVLASVADIERAIRVTLSVDEAALLYKRYGRDMLLEDLARWYEVSTSTVHRRCERALDRLLAELGGVSPWDEKTRTYHRRAVFSNAQAQAMTSVED